VMDMMGGGGGRSDRDVISLQGTAYEQQVPQQIFNMDTSRTEARRVATCADLLRNLYESSS
jgi:hypothetical protein